MQQRDARPAQRCSGTSGLDAVDLHTRAEGQGLGENPLLLLRELFFKHFEAFRPWPMCVGLIQGQRREFRVPQRDEPLREGLRAKNIADIDQPHLLDQPVMQGLIGPLHAALGLRGRGRIKFDVQTLRYASELLITFPALRLFGVDL